MNKKEKADVEGKPASIPPFSIFNSEIIVTKTTHKLPTINDKKIFVSRKLTGIKPHSDSYLINPSGGDLDHRLFESEKLAKENIKNVYELNNKELVILLAHMD